MRRFQRRSPEALASGATSGSVPIHDHRSAGEFRREIEALTAANRRRRDPAIERRLIELRADAFTPETSPGLPDWPPATPDLFRDDASWPPEVSRTELTTDRVRSAVLRHGCLLVRGLIDSPTVRRLTKDVDRALAGYDECADDPSKTTPFFAFFEPDQDFAVRRWLRESGSVKTVDSPTAFFDIVEAFDECGIRRVVTEYLGEPPAVLANKWVLRCVPPTGNPEWHQDGAFMGKDVRTINVWVTLTRCGQDAPGLDIVPRRFDDIVSPVTDNEASFDWSVGPATIDRLTDGDVARPLFEPGDALIFDHLLLHRTGVHPGMSRHRYAIEAWFAASSSYPSSQGPIVY